MGNTCTHTLHTLHRTVAYSWGLACTNTHLYRGEPLLLPPANIPLALQVMKHLLLNTGTQTGICTHTWTNLKHTHTHKHTTLKMKELSRTCRWRGKDWCQKGFKTPRAERATDTEGGPILPSVCLFLQLQELTARVTIRKSETKPEGEGERSSDPRSVTISDG